MKAQSNLAAKQRGSPTLRGFPDPDVPGPRRETAPSAFSSGVVFAPIGAIALVGVHPAIVEVDREVSRVGATVLPLQVACGPGVPLGKGVAIEVVPARWLRNAVAVPIALTETALRFRAGGPLAVPNRVVERKIDIKRCGRGIYRTSETNIRP